jgi:SAM-dependent methyltransferase
VSLGEAELLADADRPGGWLLLVDRIRQSYVDLDDPTYLDFEYMQAIADILDALPAGRLAVTHVGGGAGTLARYVAATRDGSPQIIFEPDTALVDLIRARLPFPRRARVRIRTMPGRAGVAALRDGGADVLIVDAFAGGRVPPELTTREFAAETARVLRPGGVVIYNVADGPPLTYTRRLVATVLTQFPTALLRADPGVLKRRRFGNLVLAASRARLPLTELRGRAAGAMFPQRVLAGAGLATFRGAAVPLTDADPMRSPVPPDEIWRVED